MHRRMDQDRPAVSLPQSSHCRLATVRGAVVDDPEDTAGRPVGLGSHDLLDQPAERVNPGLLLTPTRDAAAPNIPSGQVLQGASAFVLMLHAHGTSRPGRQGGVT